MSNPDRVEGIYTFVEVKPDGSEGLVGFGMGGMIMPLVTTRRDIADKMIPMARKHSRQGQVRVEMRYLGGPSEVLDVYEPGGRS
jgi:hypothetical protein